MIQWVPYGPHALLLRFADHVGEDAFLMGRAIIAELDKHPPHGLLECIPGFTTIVLQFDPTHCGNLALTGQHVATQLAELSPKNFEDRPPLEIKVRYDGEDLDTLAEEKGLTVDDVIAIHSEPIYKVYMLGFSPGFPYMGELDARLHTPRRASPRSKIAAGSVAIGGEHTGIYSIASPGGWNIIGQTEEPIFDASKLGSSTISDEAFALRAGDRVKFVPSRTTK